MKYEINETKIVLLMTIIILVKNSLTTCQFSVFVTYMFYFKLLDYIIMYYIIARYQQETVRQDY